MHGKCSQCKWFFHSSVQAVAGGTYKVYKKPGLILLYRSPAAQQPYPSALVSSSTLTDRAV